MNEHQPTTTTHHDLINLLLQDGLGEGLPKIAELHMNAAMLMERAKHIGAGPYERVEARNGHANGFKPRSFHTSIWVPSSSARPRSAAATPVPDLPFGEGQSQ